MPQSNGFLNILRIASIICIIGSAIPGVECCCCTIVKGHGRTLNPSTSANLCNGACNIFGCNCRTYPYISEDNQGGYCGIQINNKCVPDYQERCDAKRRRREVNGNISFVVIIIWHLFLR